MSGYPGGGPPSGVHTGQPVHFPPHNPSNIQVGGPPSSGVGGSGVNSGGGGAPVPDSYFTESKKGEVNELRTLLRNFATERDPQRKRDIIKKVIAYMTLGIDVSRLFTEEDLLYLDPMAETQQDFSEKEVMDDDDNNDDEQQHLVGEDNVEQVPTDIGEELSLKHI